MSRSQTLLFPSATHVFVPFKAGCVMLRLPPPSVSRNGAPSFALFLWFIFSSFIFLCKVRSASRGSTTCPPYPSHLSLQPQFSGPPPPISHETLLSVLHLPSSASSCHGPAQAASPQLRMEPSRPPMTAVRISLSPLWLEVTGELKGSRCGELLPAVAGCNCSGPLGPTVWFPMELSYHDTICLSLELL